MSKNRLIILCILLFFSFMIFTKVVINHDQRKKLDFIIPFKENAAAPVKVEISESLTPKEKQELANILEMKKLRSIRNIQIWSDQDRGYVERLFLSSSANIELRRSAAEILYINKNESFVTIMNSVLSDNTESTEVRLVALDSLFSIFYDATDYQKSQLRVVFAGMLDSKDSVLRAASLEYLCRVNDPAAIDLTLRIIDNPENFNANELASSIKGAFFLDLSSRRKNIREFLTHKDPTIVIAAIQALSNWGDTGSREIIEALTADSNKEISRIAKGAIRNYGRPQLQRVKAEEGSRP